VGSTMKPPRRQFLRLSASVAALLAVSRFARAQNYPSRPITMIVPVSAGGPTDTIARVIAERMGALLGQTVLVENVTGGGNGVVGVGRVARAAPDGYTLSVGQWGTFVINGAVYAPRWTRACRSVRFRSRSAA
jgi:tripartite-type tricarboxylate transporter receptor subunit TctC